MENSIKLRKLRELLAKNDISAYIVGHEDPHQSEYTASYYKRLEFISGFTGSWGSVIVTTKEAALWTDGRYFTQASKQLTDDWILMKMDLEDTPSPEDWLVKILPKFRKVGVDPFSIRYKNFEVLRKSLRRDSLELVPIDQNLVDVIWEETGTRPDLPKEKIFVHPICYSGMEISQKLFCVREKIRKLRRECLILSELDQIAWLFNLRGKDIPFNPVFIAYAIVTLNEVFLFIDNVKLDEQVKAHLQDVIIKSYSEISVELATRSANNEAFLASNKVTYGLIKAINENQILLAVTPVESLKAVKNETEVKGMKACHIRDGAALCLFYWWLEKQIEEGKEVSECYAADELERLQRKQTDFVSLSFTTISASGPNAAIIHYSPGRETCSIIGKNTLYLCDSGAHYRDGTTDVTRTVHFGEPTAHQKLCYTNVLRGQMNLSTTVFPENLAGRIRHLFSFYLHLYGILLSTLSTCNYYGNILSILKYGGFI
jgi:Xaa-Pro aminopeptidase